MKRVFLALTLLAIVAVRCGRVEAPARLTTVDSTLIQVDSATVDTTVVK